MGFSCCNLFWPVVKELDSTPTAEAAGVAKLNTGGVFAGEDMDIECETSVENGVSGVFGASGSPLGWPKVDNAGNGGLEKGFGNVSAAGFWVF